MEETKTTTKTTQATAKYAPKSVKTGNFKPGANRGRGGGPRRRGAARPKSEFEQKIISMRRVTRVMAGGRRFSFSVAIILGDKKGRVGLGTGKSSDTTLAIQKAVNDAKKNMVRIKTTKEFSIPHEVQAKFDASEIWLTPNNEKGVVAGGAVRDIVNLAGIKNVTGKILSRSKNHLNNAKATLIALEQLGKAKESKSKVKKEESSKEEK